MKEREKKGKENKEETDFTEITLMPKLSSTKAEE
jgi:hypothetical protein